MRFSGSLNVDLNEISTNLVPFEGMHYLCGGLSTLVGDGGGGRGVERKGVERLVKEGMSNGCKVRKSFVQKK